MRWTDNQHNQKRTITFFAFLPVVCEDDKTKNRWLEMVTIEQVWEEPNAVYGGSWHNVKFIDKEQK